MTKENPSDLRFDGVMNPFTGIGTASDRSLYTRPSLTGRRLTESEINGLYLHDLFGRTIVDLLPSDCTRRGWKIQVGDDKDGIDPFSEDFKRLGVKQVFRQAHTQARLKGGGAVIVILDDDGELSEPVTGRIRSVRAVHPVSAAELTPASWYEDIETPEYGKPSSYYLAPRTGRGGELTQVIIHADRVLRFDGLYVPEESQATYRGWGQPVLEATWQALSGIDTAAQAIVGAMHEFQFGILKLKNLKSLLTARDGQTGLRARLDAIALSKSYIKSIVLDTEEEYELRETRFAGLLEAYSIAQQNLSAVTRYPLTLFFGQAPRGFTSADENSIANYNDFVRAAQTDIYEPTLAKLTEYIALSEEGPTDGEVPDTWSVKFNELETPNELEDSQARLNYAQVDAQNIMSGIYSPDDARKRYTSAGFSADLALDEDEIGGDDETFARMLGRLNDIMDDGAAEADDG